MLRELGIPEEKIVGPESIDPNSAVALGLGLGHHRNYEQLSLDRPAFNFVLTWKKDGNPCKEVIHKAYARLYHPMQVLNGIMSIKWHSHFTASESDNGFAIFRAETQTGQVIPLEGPGVEPDDDGGVPFRFGNRPDSVILLEPTGRIYMRHGDSGTDTLKIVRWPIFDETGKRTLQITVAKRRTTEEKLRGLAISEKPYD